MFNASIPLAAPPRHRITVMQGMVEASADPNVVLTTILGSCIAACLYDPVARVGAMNHFLLAEPLRQDEASKADTHYGIYLMEMLVNAMLKMGRPSSACAPMSMAAGTSIRTCSASAPQIRCWLNAF
jgi:chemotaxis protein CheD